MESNENNENLNDSTVTIEEEAEESQEDTKAEPKREKVEAPKETPEAKRARLKRQLEQHDKKYGIKEDEKPAPEAKSDVLDSGQKALLVAYGIKGKDELELAKTWMKRTGDDIDSLVEDDIFQAKLKGLRDAKSSSEAVPKGNRRAPISSKDDLQVALAEYKTTGKMPDNQKLREQVLDEVLKDDPRNNPFTR